MILNSNGKYESQDEEEEGRVEYEEDVMDYPEVRELLVIRRALTTLFDPEFKEKIFSIPYVP